MFLRNLKQRHAGLRNSSTLFRLASGYPTLVWLHEPLQWAPSFCMEVISLVGVTVAVLGVVQPAWRTAGPLALLWLCYLSIVQCGQTFMQFQWDSFLLEVGFPAILLAKWWHGKAANELFETPSAVVWTIRFLFFKFMLMSGAVKIQSRCPTWLGLTALDFHFASQPLPLPFGWYALQVPPIINRLAVAVTLLIEGPWTFFLLAPHPTLRRVGAVQQIALQISILFTGNYNFFNLLTIILAATLLDVDNELPKKTQDDAMIDKASRILRMDSLWHMFQTHKLAKRVMLVTTLGYCVYTWLEVFEVTTVDDESTSSRQFDFLELLLATRMRLLPSVEDTQAWLAVILPRSVLFSAAVIVWSSCWQVCRYITIPDSSKRSHWSKRRVLGLVYLLTTMLASLWVFTASALTFSVLDRSFQQMLPPFVVSVYQSTEKYRITSAYGLFRTMTGVGTVQLENGQRISVVARPEIILEGTADGGDTWNAYHFKFKPGDVTSRPRIVAPFQPRLDWQMWFAALGDYQGAPWLVHLVAKLLDGSSDVKELLDTTQDPFMVSPPDDIRAQLYYYDFTRLNTSWNRAIPTANILENASDQEWWTRTFVREYMPPLERGNPSLAAFVHQHWPSRSRSSSAVKHTPETAETPGADQWLIRGLEWLCGTSWAPVALAGGVVALKSGAGAISRRANDGHHHRGKLKIQ